MSVLMNTQEKPTTRKRVSLYVALALMPATIYSGYLAYATRTEWQEQVTYAQQAQEALLAMKSEPKEKVIQTLDYPEVAELRTLADIRKGLVESVDKSNEMLPTSNESGVITSTETLINTTNSSENNRANSSDDLQLGSLDLSELSPELAQRVQSALNGNEASTSVDEEEQQTKIVLLDNESKYRGRLPALNLQTHMFSSNELNRWVKINDTEFHEGDWISESLQLITITPRVITVGFEGEIIEIPALYEWGG
jgi:general secretion pathway protein B